MLAFRVIPMGDCNAVDLAQETHLQILKDGGTMQEGETIAFRQVVPANHTLEGLYIRRPPGHASFTQPSR